MNIVLDQPLTGASQPLTATPPCDHMSIATNIDTQSAQNNDKHLVITINQETYQQIRNALVGTQTPWVALDNNNPHHRLWKHIIVNTQLCVPQDNNTQTSPLAIKTPQWQLTRAKEDIERLHRELI